MEGLNCVDTSRLQTIHCELYRFNLERIIYCLLLYCVCCVVCIVVEHMVLITCSVGISANLLHFYD